MTHVDRPGRSPLRRHLEEAVAAARASAAPEGHFTSWAGEPRILFWTRGRRTGQLRQKEWGPFAVWGSTLYLPDETGGTSDWARNALAAGVAEVARTASEPRHAVRARVVDEGEAARARDALHRRLAFGAIRHAFIDDALVIAFDHIAD